MRILLLRTFILPALLTLFLCQDAPNLKEVVKPKARVSKRLFFVLDVSASMKNDIRNALAQVRSICAQPLDEFEIAIVVFSDTFDRWEGYKEKDDPKPALKGWAKMPSEDALKAAEAWLQRHPAEGGTDPIGALKEALEEKRDELTLIIVTDGFFNDREECINTIRKGQALRVEKGLGKAIIACLGVGAYIDQHGLKVIAEENDGGFYEEDRPRQKEEVH